MFHRPLVFALCIAFVTSPVSFSAWSNNGSPAIRKSLPLDNVPNVVLKTRENSTYVNGRLIVKLMPGKDIGELNSALAGFSVASVRPMFPSQMVAKQKGDVDLSRFYLVTYTSPVDAFSAAEQVSNLPDVQYAEPSFTYPLDSFTPNDPSFGSQYGLAKIQAPQAWDITQGDTTVVIGICDSGVQLDHPDITGNIWHNPGEVGLDGSSNDKRTNGIDDDNNGFVDDWKGWDFGGADYNNVVADNNPVPTANNNEHGTHVAGIASASTNNGTGVAGTGFKCRILAIKTSADNDTRGPGGYAYILSGYEGIAYAAHVGATVVNCSWGGSGGSQTEQDIINFTTQQGTLVVASAGNTGTNVVQYPSGYNNVISVAATGATDVKAGFSTYGATVDVCAPGVSILSTIFSNTYANLDGTSMSSPYATGTAALIKSLFPSYNALQIGEKMRVTCDNIDAQNPSYVGLLGKGRINAFRALTVNLPSVRAKNFVVRDSLNGNNNGNPEPNETIDLYFTFVSYLAATANATVTLTTTAPGLTVQNGTFNIGALNPLDTVRNAASPFRLQLAGNVAAGLNATLKLTMTDGAYNDFQYFSVVINPTYQTHNVNNVEVTMTNNGRLGFNDFSNNTQGVGFLYPAQSDSNQLFEGGLIIGTSATRSVSNIRNAGGTQDNDFLSRQIYLLQSPGVISNQDGSTLFSDSSAPVGNRIGVGVTQYSYEYSSPGNDDYVIVRYDIRNLTAVAISNLYAGQFFDWDVANYATNRTAYDAPRGLSYAWDQSTVTAPYVGVRALEGVASVRGLVNSGLTLDRATKFGWISGGTAGSTVGPGDIHIVISSGPFTIAPGAIRRLGFAVMGGVNLAALQTHADAAAVKWQEILSLVSAPEDGNIPAEFRLEQNYPNPFNPGTVIRYHLPAAGKVSLKVFDVLGREVATLLDGQEGPGVHVVDFDASALSTGVYFYQLKSGASVATRKLMIVK